MYAHSQPWPTSYPYSAEPSLVDLWLRWASSLLIMVTQQDSMQSYPINSYLIFQARPIIVGIPSLDHMNLKDPILNNGFFYNVFRIEGKVSLSCKRKQKSICFTLSKPISVGFLQFNTILSSRGAQ